MSTTACSPPWWRTLKTSTPRSSSSPGAAGGLIFVLRRDLALLDVLTLGKHQAINLGVDYDRSIRRLLLGVTLCIAVATAWWAPSLSSA